jgi:hypothetical protein
MRENRTIEQFNRVMEKYRFVEPLPADVQHHLRKSKRRQFNRTLKRTSGYSALFALISNLFFTLKKYGIAITITKSAILLGIAALLTAAAASTALYFLVLQKVPDPDVITKARERVTGTLEQDSALKESTDYPAEPAAVIEDRLGVQAFTGINLPDNRVAVVTDRMARSLAALRGGDRVVNLRLGRGGKKSGMMLLGSVESSDGSFSITARVVSVKDSRILFYDTETAGSEQDINGACSRLADKIYNTIK